MHLLYWFKCARTEVRWRGLFSELTVDWPDELVTGYHVVLDTGPVVTVQWDQLNALRL